MIEDRTKSKIFLSNAPGFIIAKELQKKFVKRWMYLGTNDFVLKKLEYIFCGKAAQFNYGKKLYEITKIKRRQYILWIDQISESFLNKKEWLFSPPSVKNTCTSNLFLYSCYVSLLETFIKEGEHIDLVFVDSPALVAILKDNFSHSMRIMPVNKWLNLGFYFTGFIKSILRFVKYLIEFGRRFVSAKIILRNRGRQLLKGKKKLVFIRNFMTEEFSDTPNDVLEKHYFPGLYDYLERKNYTPAFLPIITRASSYQQLYQKVSKSKKNIVFPEEFLKLSDYLYTFLIPFRALSLRLTPPKYGKYQLDDLLREEYYMNLTEHGFLYATLLSCLGKRLKERGLSPLGMINWMENQSLEKGLIKGLKENFPDIQVIGSQPFFIQGNYLAPVLSNQERQAGLLPEKLVVLGPAGKKWATEFLEDIQVEYSPPFRYASISDPSAPNQGNNLLVLFTIYFKNSVDMMRVLLKIEPYLKAFNRIMIKLHPAASFDERKLVQALGQNLSNQYEFVHGRVEKYLSQTAVGFCAGYSGTAAELVMQGIQVITLGEPYELTFECLSCKDDEDIWQICFSCEEVVRAMNHFRIVKKERPQDLIQKAQEFQNLFIAPPREEYWENYLVKS